jgi:hypothetical protein
MEEDRLMEQDPRALHAADDTVVVYSVPELLFSELQQQFW